MNDNAIRVLGDAVTVGPAAGASLRQGAFALLRHAAAGERDAALAELDQLFALRGRFHAYPLLLDMVVGKQAWHPSGSLFVLDAAPLPPALQSHFEEAIACCAGFLELPVPCILLQCRAESRDLHLTMESFPGLAVLRLSTLSPGYPDDLRAVQFHEVAHCFLTCGVRLLDEGLAHFFASRHAGATLPAADMDLLPPMRTLLSRSADSMFGESVDSDLAVYKSACRVGADLLEAIYALGGAGRITRLFAAVARAGSEAQIVRLVEEACGQSFPAAARNGGPSAEQAVLIERARQAVFTAWINKNPKDIDEAIAALEADEIHAEPALLDSLLGARINRALLQVNFTTAPTADELAQLEMLLKAGECLPQGRLWLWRGTHAILMILLARPNIIKVASAGQQAINAFNKAVQLIPNDPDLLVQHASLLLHAPPAYGGDRDLGVSKLRQAMQDPVYREHARQVLLEYGVEMPVEEAVAVAAARAPDAPPTAPAPALLELSGVELRLSSSFTLRPGALTVRRGERVAFIGRNGSGKSMLMETLLGLRQPDRGTVSLHLGDPRDAATRQRIGGLLQGYDLPGQTKVREMMALHQAMYQRTDAAVTRALGMDELRDRFWQQLSRGQKQRVMLWMALAHVPELAILDEPSLGLDEWFARALRELLAALPMALLVISHAPSDLLGMDRICCLDDGRIVAEGTLASLMEKRVGQFKGVLRQALSEAALQALRALPALVQAPRERDGAWELFGGAGFDQGFRQFIEQQRIGAFSLEPVSVEDFLADVTQIVPTTGQSS
ncbi:MULTISPECIES: ATP-binding cassette domain-containing protein [unclassified Duganella]|uniref:ATP-binding cassette domain-containing protein n=1 Tax=unclassified Duganella TaxID=2636909 RepID=UPI000E35280F|nr:MULTISPECIES: ABC transporter ATP-binding protein [unclassified Duganella]RFP16266.1 ABC transporter ATP-binding protein [Duganella sp. BJB475]RFP32572.1 ABC transporter ATP-binding protein [Duganella sp. BJB476]